MKKLFFYLLKHLFHGAGFRGWEKMRRRQAYSLMKRKAADYNTNIRPRVEAAIAAKEEISILFFVFTMGMWKYDKLMRLLMKEPAIKPVIIPFVMPGIDKDSSRYYQDAVINYCKANSFPFRTGYDFNTDTYTDISDLKPDIVVYSQPYDIGYAPWLIDNFKQHSLFIYTPYGASGSSGRQFYDTYLTNISRKIFSANELESEVLLKYIPEAKSDIVETGVPLSDELKDLKPSDDPWPKNGKKRIIWAPHHSIDTKNSFSTSNFERICDDMLRLAEKYADKVEFAFKPHPVLRERLIEKWGSEKADSYYKKWESLGNGRVCLGEYTALFAFSDGMIHDCVSFATEYLFTGQPVMFICKDGKVPKDGLDSVYGIACFNRHYKGYTMDEITHFIENVVIEGNDPMKGERETFTREQLQPPGGKTTAENMLGEIKSLFNKRS